MIVDHLDLIKARAWAVASRTHWDIDDLISQGYLIAMEAMKDFDAGKGKVSTYLWHRVEFGLLSQRLGDTLGFTVGQLMLEPGQIEGIAARYRRHEGRPTQADQHPPEGQAREGPARDGAKRLPEEVHGVVVTGSG
jgi:hypothetical protein